ncbi:MAG TPA: hypothetical protein VLX29_04305 [Nitrospirota bacterium]|nr:hypothetical protein [Nitrospirota bacterium]
MKRSISFLFILSLLFSAVACSSKVPLDRTGIQTKSILSVLNDISRSYENKNLSAFLSNVSDSYSDRDTFSNSLVALFAKCKAINFKIHYTKMLIVITEKGQIKVSCNWETEWLALDGTSQKNGGRVTFVFEQKNFKLASIDGASPFFPVNRPIRP